MEYPWAIEPQSKMMIEVQKCPDDASFSDEESYETASEGEDVDIICPPPPLVLAVPSSVNREPESKPLVEPYSHYEGIIVKT